jgi:2,3,4,5-tetrahydropyridine-2-carboxylate N-succinyltransferase
MRKATGQGIATITFTGEVLDVWYYQASLEGVEAGSAISSEILNELTGEDEIRQVQKQIISREIDLDGAPVDTADVYLRLHLLSYRLVKPHGTISNYYSRTWNNNANQIECKNSHPQ